MGQSSHTAMAIIGAEVLGITPNDVRVVSGDTDSDPLDIGAFTQRGTFNTGNAVKNACTDARDQLAKTAATKLEVDESTLVFKNYEIYPDGEPEKALVFKDVVYDKVARRIKDIPGLTFSKLKSKFTLKRTDKKNSTLKGLAPRRGRDGRKAKIDIHLEVGEQT